MNLLELLEQDFYNYEGQTKRHKLKP